MTDTDSRRYFLAGYLSALPEYAGRHPETMLPVADQIIAMLTELDPQHLELTVPAPVTAAIKAKEK